MARILLCLAAFFFSGCAGFVVVPAEDGPRESRQSLTAEQCKERCQSQFHECRASGRSDGPGNSGCAHEKNRCERSCR